MLRHRLARKPLRLDIFSTSEPIRGEYPRVGSRPEAGDRNRARNHGECPQSGTLDWHSEGRPRIACQLLMRGGAAPSRAARGPVPLGSAGSTVPGSLEKTTEQAMRVPIDGFPPSPTGLPAPINRVSG